MKKIVVIGPESTGKSTLCEQLAAHYKTDWVREYAREYLLKNGTDYSYEDLLTIAKGQIAGEESGIIDRELGIGNWGLGASSQTALNLKPLPVRQAGQASNFKPVFIDTDMYVMKVWSEYVFGRCHHWILNRIVERKYDLYLLCHPDLPWVKDELREYPDQHTREILFHHYKDIMVNQSVPFVDISGDYEERLRKAIEAIDNGIMDNG